MIRQDHYHYDIMNRTVLCVDTQSAHLKRYSDINIKASTYVCNRYVACSLSGYNSRYPAV